jgi:hypothetical protein
MDSAGAKATSWDAGDGPAPIVLEIVPQHAERLPALLEALGGPGRPAGIVAVEQRGAALRVELDERLTPLRFLVDLVDLELAHAPGRRITPLLPLADESLAAFAAATLAAPEISASRLVESFVEPLLRGGG